MILTILKIIMKKVNRLFNLEWQSFIYIARGYTIDYLNATYKSYNHSMVENSSIKFTIDKIIIMNAYCIYKDSQEYEYMKNYYQMEDI